MSKANLIDPTHCEWCAKGRPGPKALPISYVRLLVIVQVVFILATGAWAVIHLAEKASTGEPVWIGLAIGYALAMTAATAVLAPKMVRDWRGVSRPKSKQEGRTK